MKKFTQLLTLFAFASLIIFVACKKKTPTPTEADPKDTFGAALNGTWSPSSVKLDDQTRDEWADFTITVTYSSDSQAGTYQVNGVPTNDGADAVWGNNVTWTVTSIEDNGTNATLTRQDTDNIVVQASVDNVDTPTSLTFTFTVPTAGGRIGNERVDGFTGKWEFVFTK